MSLDNNAKVCGLDRSREALFDGGNTDQPARTSDGSGFPFIKFEKRDIDQSLSRRFEQQAETYPERLAIKTDRQTINYCAANRQANRIGRAILDSGSKSRKPIGILMDKDAPLILSILGVLKTGRCYVPLDPSLPISRMIYSLEYSMADLILTDKQSLERAIELAGSKMGVVCYEEIDCGIPANNLELKCSPYAIAFILYTSGSTGMPKGVVQTNRNKLHSTRNYTNSIGIVPNDRVSVLSSFSFGAAAMDMFAGLLNGASLWPFDLKSRGLRALIRWLIENEITIYHSVPTVLRHLMWTVTDEDRFPNLRVIDLGGEVVRKVDVDLFKRVFSANCTLVNGLGCTELNVVRQFHIRHDTEINTDPVPVGYGVDDVEVLLMDENGQPTRQGEIGEIVIRSRHLALGYWRMPGLTRSVFKPDPDRGGMRRYHTGDLARLLSDGRLVVVGRKDSQVKIRGCRVELGEIESKLLEMDGIKEVAVVPRVSALGEKVLVAYVVPAGEPSPNIRRLRAYLLSHLPDYMVPAAFVFLDNLPQTFTGKIDRLSLPSHHNNNAGDEANFLPPQNSTEKAVAQIWMQLLDLDRVGIRDDFFELGGDSLLAMRLAEQIKNDFKVEMALRTLFHASTVEAQAKELETRRGAPSDSTEIKCFNNQPAAPLTLAQKRFWLRATRNLWRVVRLQGPLNLATLESALAEIVRRHDILRARISMIDREPVQETVPFRGWRLDVKEVSSLHEGEPSINVKDLIREEISRNLDLSRGPLFRTKLLRFGEDEHYLLLTMHHLVFDGWSWDLMRQEMEALYRAFSEGRRVRLEPLPIQYADYAKWQEESERKTNRRGEAVLYWKRKLANLPDIKLPDNGWLGRMPQPEQVEYIETPYTMPAKQSRALAEFAKQERTTLQVVLLSAYQILLSRYTGYTDIIVDFPVVGREHPETLKLIGCFVRDLAIRTDLSSDPTLRQLVSSVHQDMIEAYVHPEICFVEQAEEFRPAAGDLVFPFNFRMQPTPLSALNLPGIKASFFHLEHPKVTPHSRLSATKDAMKHILILDVVQNQAVIELRLTGKGLFFDRGHLAGMIEHLIILLDFLCSDPDIRISKLPLPR
jgi:amino acid adenylation domain-containing protein